MKTLLAGLALTTAVLGIPVAAHASGSTYQGGCDMTFRNDTTPGGQMGGPYVWNGEVHLAVVPTTGGFPNGSSVTASCELRVNGISQGTILGPTSGTSEVVDVAQTQFTAAFTDVVSLCDHVTTIQGTEVNCRVVTLTEAPGPACSDGRDNDGDGLIDYYDNNYDSDPGCSDGLDNDESDTSSPCPSPAGVPVCVSFTTGSVINQYTVNGPTNVPTQVAGYVDSYQFTLPNGGVTTLPCVVLVAGPSGANPCQAAGGTFVARVQTLVNQTAGVPDVTVPAPVAVVRVCNATLVVTVDGFGVNSFPAYMIC